MFCLDADFIISVLKRDPKALDLLSEIEAQGALYISSVNVLELYHTGGDLSSKRVKVLSDLLENLEVLPFDKGSALLAGRIGTELRRKGKILSSMDLMIGAIALHNSMTLITRNMKHCSRIDGLEITSW